MQVEDDPVTQWLFEIDINALLAAQPPVERSREGNDLNLHVNIRFLRHRHPGGSVTGVDSEYERVRGSQLHIPHAHSAAPCAPAEVIPDHKTGNEDQQSGHHNSDNYWYEANRGGPCWTGTVSHKAIPTLLVI